MEDIVEGEKYFSYVTMGAMASQISSFAIVYSTVYSGADQGKHQSSASLAFAGNSPAQMASYAENAFIWWRHHESKVRIWSGLAAELLTMLRYAYILWCVYIKAFLHVWM